MVSRAGRPSVRGDRAGSSDWLAGLAGELGSTGAGASRPGVARVQVQALAEQEQ